MARTTTCSPTVQAGRLAKAVQFWHAAEIIVAVADEQDDVGDAYVTLCVHAGVAAADVVCCAALGEHASGERHHAAVALLARVDRPLSKHLGTLLGMKTSAGYSHRRSTGSEQTRAGRARVGSGRSSAFGETHVRHRTGRTPDRGG